MLDDKQRLKDFFSEVYLWLEGCYLRDNGSVRFPRRWLSEKLADDGVQAWREFTSDHPLELYLDAIDRLTEEQLKRNGLSGMQLSLKLNYYESLIDRVKNAIKRHSPSERLPSGVAKKILEVISILIQSILDELGVGEAYKELIDVVAIQGTEWQFKFVQYWDE